MISYDPSVGRGAAVSAGSGVAFTVLLAGNPNAGKTSLFNALTGLRARTANFPGTTVEHRLGSITVAGQAVEIIDLPGMYSLHATSPEEAVARDVMLQHFAPTGDRRGAVVVIADASNLERNLLLVGELLEEDIPVVLALNMIDVAERRGIEVDVAGLSAELGCPVVPMVAKSGIGVGRLREQIAVLLAGGDATAAHAPRPPTASCKGCGPCPFQSRYEWTEQVTGRCVKAPRVEPGSRTERIDSLLTRPVTGILAFLGVMLSVFYLIFSVASVPMDIIDTLFARTSEFLSAHIPAGDLRSLLVDGVIGGVGGVLVFLPQICILFFFLALLEDSGYLARAAFVMDRLMRRIGLPGTAFVPLLSAHACAIPAIMAARVITDPRDRLVTILVAPLMTCSARIPVYAMVTALLFPESPGWAALVFTGAYGLGIVAALGTAFVLKRTVVRGETKPLVLELPGYRIPSLRTALLLTLDRARVFIRQAGTIILLMSLLLWVLATYPHSHPSPAADALRAEATATAAAGNTERAAELTAEAAGLDSQHGLSHSFAGHLGRIIEPVVRPLGFDWQIGIGVVSSFAAREVIVSTLAIVYGIGEEGADDAAGLYDTLRRARRENGQPVFTAATSLSLLVFYVLAMQCLPTQAVTKRETGSWKWAFFQLGYMTALAYAAAALTFNGLRFFGIA